MHRFFICSLVIVVLIAAAATTFAAQPQIDYPDLGIGVDIGGALAGGTLTFADFARYVYTFFIMIGGITVLAGLSVGGFKWLTAVGNPSRVSEARSHIFASFIGLIILLGSWIFLRSIDADLVELSQIGPKVATEASESVEKDTLDDGLIFVHTVQDDEGQDVDEEIPVINGRLNEGNVSTAGIENELIGEMQSIRFIIPAGPIPQFPAYHYGIVCFDQPGFEGRIHIMHSAQHTMSPRQNDPSILESDDIALDFSETPCLSARGFRMPSFSFAGFYEELSDNITFYEFISTQRERETIAANIPGGPSIPDLNKELVGGCTNIGKRKDIDCETVNEDALSIAGQGALHHSLRIVPADACSDLLGITTDTGDPDDPDDDTEREWYPRSMEILSDRVNAAKYLVFLFPKLLEAFDPDGIRAAGHAYMFDIGVNNFTKLEESARLYWNNLTPQQLGTSGFKEEWQYLPKSCLIYPVEEVF